MSNSCSHKSCAHWHSYSKTIPYRRWCEEVMEYLHGDIVRKIPIFQRQDRIFIGSLLLSFRLEIAGPGDVTKRPALVPLTPTSGPISKPIRTRRRRIGEAGCTSHGTV
jgi:hypothetical protein